MMQLKNWYLENVQDGIIGHGYVYQSPKFTDGKKLLTSYAVSIEADNEKLRVKLVTKSGSCYYLDFAEMNEKHLQDTKEVIDKSGICLDIEKCLKAKRERIEKILSPRELYVRMSGGQTAQEAYFKTKDGGLVYIPIRYHTGDWTDSVLISNGLCDWRFFPHGDHIECYSWSDGIDMVKLENTNPFDFIYRGAYRDILCEKDEITAIKKEEYAGGFRSPDVKRLHPGEMLTQDEIVKLLSP